MKIRIFATEKFLDRYGFLLTCDECGVIVPARYVQNGQGHWHNGWYTDVDRIFVNRVQSQLSVAVRSPDVDITVF